jgi:hypothetical protein
LIDHQVFLQQFFDLICIYQLYLVSSVKEEADYTEQNISIETAMSVEEELLFIHTMPKAQK